MRSDLLRMAIWRYRCAAGSDPGRLPRKPAGKLVRSGARERRHFDNHPQVSLAMVLPLCLIGNGRVVRDQSLRSTNFCIHSDHLFDISRGIWLGHVAANISRPSGELCPPAFVRPVDEGSTRAGYPKCRRLSSGRKRIQMVSECAKNLSHQQVNISAFDERDEAVEFEWQRFRVEKICSILRTIPDKEVGADLGCLSGMATSLYATTGIKTLHAFDISQTSLDKVRAKGFAGFFWDADGGRCPMPDNTYDLLIAGEIIEHLIDTDHFAEEVRRILKPNAYLILSTPNLASWYNRIRLLRGRVPTSYPGPSSTISKDQLIDNNHIRVNVLSEWTHFLQSHGFTIQTVYGSSHLQGLHGGWRTRLIKFIDRLACRHPSLSTNIIVVARKT